MRSKYGLQVDAWGAYIPDKGDLEDGLEEAVGVAVMERELNGVSVFPEHIGFEEVFRYMWITLSNPSSAQARKHLIVRENLGNGGWATIAMRVERRGGKD